MLALVLAVVAVLVLAGVAYAAWTPGSLSATGTITAVEAADDYTLSVSTVAFDDVVIAKNTPFTLWSSDPVTMTNTGTTVIGGVDIAGTSQAFVVGAGVATLTNGVFPLAYNESVTFTISFTGCTTTQNVNLSGNLDISVTPTAP